MPLARRLFFLRGLLGGSRPDAERSLLDVMARLGFGVVLDDPPRALAIGGIGPVWRPRGRLVRFAGDEGFREASPPGVVKVVMGYELRDDPRGTRLETETRIAATDARARRRFAAYWLLVRAGSGAVRHSMLRAIARRAAG